MLSPIEHLLAAAWFLLPAGAANVAPVIAAWLLPTLDAPVDFGCSLRGKRLFGAHKTWRGIAAGILAATIVFSLQRALVAEFPTLHAYGYVDYADAPRLLGAWMGTAALLGDLAKSTLKRQFGIAPGSRWIPFDQIDWLLGTILLTLPFVALSGPSVAAILIVGGGLHLGAHFLGYVLGLNPTRI